MKTYTDEQLLTKAKEMIENYYNNITETTKVEEVVKLLKTVLVEAAPERRRGDAEADGPRAARDQPSASIAG